MTYWVSQKTTHIFSTALAKTMCTYFWITPYIYISQQLPEFSPTPLTPSTTSFYLIVNYTSNICSDMQINWKLIGKTSVHKSITETWKWWTMVHMLGGNSEHVVHVRMKLGLLWRKSIRFVTACSRSKQIMP